MMMVSKGSYKDLEVKDEKVGSAHRVGREEWDKEKHVDEDLQALGPDPSFTMHTMKKAPFFWNRQ